MNAHSESTTAFPRARTLEEVARVAGVSRNTVSLAIRLSPGVNAQTRQRVLLIVRQTGYRPNFAARALAGRRTRAPRWVGMLLRRHPTARTWSMIEVMMLGVLVALDPLAAVFLLPIAAVAFFLVILRWPARHAMPISYFTAVALALFVWQVPSLQVAAASVRGLIIAAELLYIIFGAILLLNTLEASGAMATLTEQLGGDADLAAVESLQGFADRIRGFPSGCG